MEHPGQITPRRFLLLRLPRPVLRRCPHPESLPLREVLHRLEKRCSFLHGEITGFSNSLSVCHPLDRGYLEDRLKEAIAKSTATHEAREMVWTILEELERLSEWHD